jgi:hypothetical protein
MDELIASGVANISTAGAGTTKDIVDAILGTIDVTDGVSQEDINAAIAVLDSGLVTIDDVAKAVGLPADVVSAAYEANKPAVDVGVVSGRTAAAQESEPIKLAPPALLPEGYGSTIDRPFSGVLSLPDINTLRGNVFDEDLEYQDAKELYQDIQEGLVSGATDSAGAILKAIIDSTIASQNQAGASANNFPAGTWYDPDTGLVIPDFDPVTGKGMGTLFPVFYPDVTQTSSGGGGGGGGWRWWFGGGGGGGGAASSDSSAAQAAADAAAAAGVTGGESVTWEDLYNYSQGEYRPAPTARRNSRCGSCCCCTESA